MPVVNDFTVAVNPASLTVTAGQSATATVTITAVNKFYETVSLSCSGLPAGAYCNFSVPVLSPGTTSASTTVTIQTSASASNIRSGLPPIFASMPLALVLCWFGPIRRRRFLSLLLVGILCGLCSLTSCGSGPGGGGGQNPTSNQYTSTITATANTAQHAATFTITVNK